MPFRNFRFNNEIKNYKVYYDGAFYVGDKRFDSIIDLVHDGLISFYIEKHASNYIALMCEENNYSESPYVASKAALLAAKQAPPAPPTVPKMPQPSQPASSSSSASTSSIHNSFLKQHNHLMTNGGRNETTSSNFFPPANANGASTAGHSANGSAGGNGHQSMHMSANHSASLSLLSSKSNTIFDRFDIMNSEKPHRFKVRE